ncbi:IS3 family transposase, partial [Flavobacterium tegetincola]
YHFSSFQQLNACLKEYINWYNTKRLHSTLGYISPLEMEIKLRNFNNKAA